jgi:hypothetical protein
MLMKWRGKILIEVRKVLSPNSMLPRVEKQVVGVISVCRRTLLLLHRRRSRAPAGATATQTMAIGGTATNHTTIIPPSSRLPAPLDANPSVSPLTIDIISSS